MIHTITQNGESHTVWESTLLLSPHVIFYGAVLFATRHVPEQILNNP